MDIKKILLSERGNTLLTNDDSFMAWMKLEPNLWLQVSWFPENYPALNIHSFEATEQEVAKMIQTFSGWMVRKINVDGVKINDGLIA